MRRPRRNHTAAFKAKVALVALKGDKTLAELAEKYDVHGNQITQWKTQLLEGGIGVFMSPAEKRGTEHGPTAKGGLAMPMTSHLRLGGKQFVVIAAGGHGSSARKLGDSLRV